MKILIVLGNQKWLERLWPTDSLYAFYRDITKCIPPDIYELQKVPLHNEDQHLTRRDNISNGNFFQLMVKPWWSQESISTTGLKFRSKNNYKDTFSNSIAEVI